MPEGAADQTKLLREGDKESERRLRGELDRMQHDHEEELRRLWEVGTPCETYQVVPKNNLMTSITILLEF